VPTQKTATLLRYLVRMAEMEQAMRIASRRCRIPERPINVTSRGGRSSRRYEDRASRQDRPAADAITLSPNLAGQDRKARSASTPRKRVVLRRRRRPTAPSRA